METYIAILRGINVSGQKLIKMEDLKSYMEELNFSYVSTYIQSGNIIFQTEILSEIELAKLIEKKILKEYNFEVPVIVRSDKYFNHVLKNNPFINAGKAELDKLYVTFLASKPSEKIINSIETITGNIDEYKIIEDVIYIYCQNGYGNTKLNNNYFEKKLKIQATTRNWKTVVKLTDIANAIG